MKYSKYAAALVFFILYSVMNIVFCISRGPESVPGTTILNFQNSDQISFSDAVGIAEKQGCILYATSNQIIMAPDQPLVFQKTVYTIYAAEKDKTTVLHRHLGLKTGAIRGTDGIMCEVIVSDIMTLDQDSELRQGIESLCIIGHKESCTSCIRSLKNAYPNAFGEVFDITWGISYSFPAILLGLIFMLLLFGCYLDSAFEKKEIAIYVLHGDSSIRHYIRICLTDTAMFSALFLICIFAQCLYTQITMPFRISFYQIFPFLFGIWMINLQLLRIHPKEMLYGHQLSSKILRAFSVLGQIAAIFSCFVILYAIGMTESVQQFDSSKSFIQSHKNDAYLELKEPQLAAHLLQKNQVVEYKSLLEKTMNDERKFLKEADAVLQPVTIADLSDNMKDSGMQVIWDSIYCNHRALPYLQTVISEAAEIDLSHYDVALLFPDTFPLLEQKKAENYLMQCFETYEGYRPVQSNIQILFYKPEAPLMTFDFAYRSFDYHDFSVICVASNTYCRKNADQLQINHHFLTNSSVFQNFEQLDAVSLGLSYSFRAIFHSVYDRFYEEYKKQQVLLLTTILVSALMFIFYISVIYTILKLDYQVNAIELAIRKTLGESVWQKNQKYFIIAAVVLIINLVLAITISLWKQLLPLSSAIAVPVILFLLNILLIVALIHRIEQQKITKILKGGAL